MKNKKVLSIILVTILLIVGITAVVLYKLGDRIFDEAINMQITEMENLVDASQKSAVIESQPEPLVPIQPGEQPIKTDTATGQDIQVTKEKLEDIKESITPSEKVAAATLVLSKLSKSDINRLTELSAGGITPEEKAQIKDIVYSRFTSEEIEKLREMYIKYVR